MLQRKAASQAWGPEGHQWDLTTWSCTEMLRAAPGPQMNSKGGREAQSGGAEWRAAIVPSCVLLLHAYSGACREAAKGLCVQSCHLAQEKPAPSGQSGCAALWLCILELGVIISPGQQWDGDISTHRAPSCGPRGLAATSRGTGMVPQCPADMLLVQSKLGLSPELFRGKTIHGSSCGFFTFKDGSFRQLQLITAKINRLFAVLSDMKSADQLKWTWEAIPNWVIQENFKDEYFPHWSFWGKYGRKKIPPYFFFH